MNRVYFGTAGLCAASPILFGWWSLPLLAAGAILFRAAWQGRGL